MYSISVVENRVSLLLNFNHHEINASREKKLAVQESAFSLCFIWQPATKSLGTEKFTL